MHKIRAKQRQHIVEWIPGVGVVTDGVVDATSTSGPWTWTPPEGVVTGVLDACGPGGGGGGGYGSTNNRGGGGGGGAGLSAINIPVVFVPGSAITVTAGAAGTGGTIGANGTSGGATTITGLGINGAAIVGKLTFAGGLYGNGSTGTGGGNGGSSGNNGGGSGGAAGTAGGAGSSTTVTAGAFVIANFPGGGGGGANASASVAGAGGGYSQNIGNNWGMLVSGAPSYSAYSGAGNTDGAISYGGGGGGGASLLGQGGKGGAGNAASAVAASYGGGGGGGGGNAAGAAGGASYIRLTYWSVP